MPASGTGVTHVHAGHNLEKSHDSVTSFINSIYKIRQVIPKSVFIPDYPSNPRTFGEQLLKNRLDFGLKIKEVAEAVGVKPESITNWEKGHTRPRKDLVERLEGFYGVDRVT